MSRPSPLLHPWVLVAVGTVAVLVLHIWITGPVGAPSVIPDEAGYLGNARWLAGEPGTWGMGVAPYYGFGYPLLLVGLFRLIDDPDLLWRAILVENAVLLATLVPLLFLFCRRVLRAGATAAVVAAVVGATVPAATAASGSATSENLALPLLVATALALHSALRDGPLLLRVWFGPAVVLLLATHPRSSPIVAVALVTVLIAWWRRLVPARVALGNLALLVGLTLVAMLVRHRLETDRWGAVDAAGGTVGDLLEFLSEPDGWAEVGRNVIGQAWYLAVGSLGLAVLGGWLLGRRVVGYGEGDLPAPAAAERATAAFVLAAAAGVFATSVAFFAQVQFFDDHLVYGRHNDTFSPIWVAAALVLLHEASSRRSAVVRIGAALAVLTTLSLLLITLRDPVRYLGVYRPFAVPALSRFADATSTFYWQASAAGAVGAVVIGVGTWVRRRPMIVAFPVAVWFAFSGAGRVEDVDRFENSIYRDWSVPEEVEALGVERAALDANAGGGVTLVMYQWAMPEVRFDVYDPDLGETARGPFVFARLDDPAFVGTGARVALVDEGPHLFLRRAAAGIALWVRPGPEQARLARRQQLLPPGFPRRGLRPESLRSEIAVRSIPAGDPLRVRQGVPLRLDVRVRHTGTGSPWIDRASFGLDGRVQLGARITPVEPAGTVGLLARGELPKRLEPGEATSAKLRVPLLGERLQPLRPGRYRVEVGIVEAGRSSFTPSTPPATVTIEVTPA